MTRPFRIVGYLIVSTPDLAQIQAVRTQPIEGVVAEPKVRPVISPSHFMRLANRDRWAGVDCQ